jgi:hypothetical protein
LPSPVALFDLSIHRLGDPLPLERVNLLGRARSLHDLLVQSNKAVANVHVLEPQALLLLLQLLLHNVVVDGGRVVKQPNLNQAPPK